YSTRSPNPKCLAGVGSFGLKATKLRTPTNSRREVTFLKLIFRRLLLFNSIFIFQVTEVSGKVTLKFGCELFQKIVLTGAVGFIADEISVIGGDTLRFGTTIQRKLVIQKCIGTH